MSTRKNYESTARGLQKWADGELHHVGRIASMKDKDLQYSYAMSTVNGMAHLKDALYQYIQSSKGSPMIKDLQVTHDKVVRVMKHLVKTYKLDLNTIVKFNTKKVLSSFKYLKNANGTRKQKK
jgi:hypothetical protein